MEPVKFLPAGDSAVSVQFGNVIDPAVYQRVHALQLQLDRAKLPGIVEVLPTYRALMVHYDPGILPFAVLVKELNQLIASPFSEGKHSRKVITIPVCFGGELGEDLDFVAQYHHTTSEEIVRLFGSEDFLIYMLGFTPGYPYIGGVPDGLATPRLETPRVKIPAGSVGIGGKQLGIYPIVSPGGFQLVGRTPVRLYDPGREQPILLEAGEYIRFQAVSREEYDEILCQVEAGRYTCRIEEDEG